MADSPVSGLSPGTPPELLLEYQFTKEKLEHENNSRWQRMNGLLRSSAAISLGSMIASYTLISDSKDSIDPYLLLAGVSLIGIVISFYWGFSILRGSVSILRRASEMIEIWEDIIKPFEEKSLVKKHKNIIVMGESEWLDKKSYKKVNPSIIFGRFITIGDFATFISFAVPLLWVELFVLAILKKSFDIDYQHAVVSIFIVLIIYSAIIFTYYYLKKWQLKW